MKKPIAAVVIMAVLVVLGAGYWYASVYHAQLVAADTVEAQQAVAQFGSVLKNVALLAPDAPEQISHAYAPYVAPELLVQWESNVTTAPGRLTSSPWPERIEVISAQMTGGDTCVVTGTVVEVTSNELAHGGVAGTYPVVVALQKQNGRWLITSFTRAARTP